MRHTVWFLGLCLAFACEGEGAETSDDADVDADSDVDTDTDTATAGDTDVDTDTGGSDTDTDTDTTDPSLDGLRRGRCDYVGVDPYDPDYFDMSLNLEETSGEVLGVGLLQTELVAQGGTTYVAAIPFVVSGTWDGATVVLQLGYDIGPSVSQLPLEFQGTLDGANQLLGTLTLSPDGTSGYTPRPYDCVLSP